MVLFCAAALAAPAVDATILAGARSAPESAIQVPSAWEGTFDPSALLSAELRARFGASEGPWARLLIGGWAYAPDMDASLATAGAELGWSRERDGTTLSAAGRYNAQVFPGLMDATNGRAEVVALARRDARTWAVTGQVTGVARRFVAESGFSTAEVGGVVGFSPAAWGLDLGVSGQGNVGTEAVAGAQARSLVRLRAGGDLWRIALEHRFIYAAGGEADAETRAAFTPVGDYADDADALSGAGFVQQRVGANGAVTTGPWTLSLGGFVRARSGESEEESAVAFARTWNAQARVGRALGERVDAFVAGGAASATLGTGVGYWDGFGWVGVDVRGP